MSGRRLTIGLLALAVAGAAAALVADGQRREPVEWSLLGTRDEGRSVIIGFFGSYEGCPYDVRARTGEADIWGIELVVDAKSHHCETLGGGDYFRPLVVPIGAAIDGRPIRGKMRASRPQPDNSGARSFLPGPPQVVGLNLIDAYSVAATLEYSVRLGDPGRRLRSGAIRRQAVSERTVTVWFD